ncbi:MAG: M18 family aminopeptidase [Eubacterium sp.]|nr:M18 family aminopeptidase [Eubacterium sp.]
MYENITKEMLFFIEASPSCYQAAANIIEKLEEQNYTFLPENSEWKLEEGGAYYTERNGSSVIAFRIPDGEASSFRIMASHSDSPTFKIKPEPEMKTAGAYVRLNIEKYGGMLCNTWFDRPLGIAGRVIVREEDGTLAAKNVFLDEDICMIPSLAIHMDRTQNENHAVNVQNDMPPIFGDEEAEGAFLKRIAEAADAEEEQILGCDIFLVNRQKGTFVGVNHEYIASPRLDDLECAYTTLAGFLESGSVEMSDEFPAAASIPVLAVFDNEEVGSLTRQGADSTFLEDVLERIAEGLSWSRGRYHAAVADSFMISADNAHALHPNFPGKADPVNRPVMNKGIVLKFHAGQKYTTDGMSEAFFKKTCMDAEVPFQIFTNRADMAGGSTLGNISNAHVSIRTADIGLAQLAMHSAMETAGAKDPMYLAAFAETFFRG